MYYMVLARAVEEVWNTPSDDIWSRFNLGEIGLILIALGAIAGLYQLHRDWVKRRGFRMVLKDRNDKIYALLVEIIQDGILDAEVAGKLSHQETDRLFADLQKKLGLHDLVPKKRLQRIVKNELKAARYKREHPETELFPPEKGGKRIPKVKKKKFSETLGKTAFWQKTAA